jgi:16S rRNA (cytidine1402-2'-O)-methyltransferase
VLFEAPNRVAATVRDLLGACDPSRRVCVAREITKVHEEVLEGPLGLVAGVSELGEPRGEHVIVLEGLTVVTTPVTEDDLSDAVRGALDRGLSARDTAAEVAAALGVSKRRAYERAVTLRTR